MGVFVLARDVLLPKALAESRPRRFVVCKCTTYDPLRSTYLLSSIGWYLLIYVVCMLYGSNNIYIYINCI